MFSVSLADGLLLLEVEANDGLIGLFYGLLLLDACGGITVSRRPHTPSRRRVDGVDGNGTPSRRYFGSTAVARPRRGPNGLKISQKNTQRML